MLSEWCLLKATSEVDTFMEAEDSYIDDPLGELVNPALFNLLNLSRRSILFCCFLKIAEILSFESTVQPNVILFIKTRPRPHEL